MDNIGVVNGDKGFIFNIQKYNVHDGPGIRTLVFFKGCPLRCKWCSNPEGLERKYQVLYKKDQCINCGACASVCPVGIHTMDPIEGHKIRRDISCIGCRACENNCMEFALAISGKKMTVEEVVEVIEEDRMFYYTTGGGVTLGGGEVTAQAKFATNLLKTCKARDIHTAIETCGYANREALLEMAQYIDLVLFDLKHMDSDRHYQLTGVRNELILNNLRELLERGHDVQIRMPLLKGINDSKEEIDQIVEFLLPYKAYKNLKGIDLLPYHKMGVNKYDQLDKEYGITGDPSLTDEDLDQIEDWIKRHDFPVQVVRH